MSIGDFEVVTPWSWALALGGLMVCRVRIVQFLQSWVVFLYSTSESLGVVIRYAFTVKLLAREHDSNPCICTTRDESPH
jgi:hypothetical protein